MNEGENMSVAEVNQVYTPEDSLVIPDGDAYELVDGRLVEKNIGMKSSWVASELLFHVRSFLATNPLGWVSAETSYQCSPDDPKKVRRPDVSFVRYGRLPEEELPDGHCPIAPDVAVEVTSPNDTYYDVIEKVETYLSAGVSLVWVVNPNTRTVFVYRKDRNTIGFLHENDELSGEDILPGFRCPVREILPPPKKTQPG
jgi:Uma2 family endonuclease